MMMKTMLTVYGYAVIEAANGEEAVRLAHKRQSRVILMDLNMPVMDGVEATRRIRTSSETKHIPIIILSAYSNDFALRKEMLELGANECLTKPIDVDKLKAVLRTHTK